MQKTPHLNLHILPASEESTKTAREFMRELGDDQATSNMMIIDGAIADLTDGVAKAESDIKTAKQEAISAAASDATAKASAAEAAAKAASRSITWMPTATDVGAFPNTGGILGGDLELGPGNHMRLMGDENNLNGIDFYSAAYPGEPIDPTSDIGLHVGNFSFMNKNGEMAPGMGLWAGSYLDGAVTGFVMALDIETGMVKPYVLRADDNWSIGRICEIYHELNKPTPADIGAAVPSKVTSFTLAVAGWIGTAAPYTQTVTTTGVTANSNGTVGVADNATDAQWTAAGKAQLRKTAQAANSLTVKAYGEKPTIDIPCSVVVVG